MDAPRILITGASGFVGQHLVSALIRQAPDIELICIDRQGGISASQEGRVSHYAVDLCNRAEVIDVVAQHLPTHIVHLAAAASGAGTDRDLIFQVNVEGTRSLLDAAAEIAPFPRVLFVSTGYVYGDRTGLGAAVETSPLGPLWRFGAYTDSKIEAENCARNYPAFTIIARPFTHIGPGQAPGFAVSSFARQIARIEAGLSEPVIKVGNLEALRDILDVRDVVEAYRLLLTSGKPGEAYNVSTQRPVDIQSLLDKLLQLAKLPVNVEVDPTRLRPADIQCSTGDSTKILTETGWRPQIPLEQTLADTLNYWRETEGG
jgi:GDP-4-dehydro-6-deoxy-D-mannose reductase